MVYWTKEESEFMKENYPIKGGMYCAEKLGKSYHTIACKATRLKLSYTKSYQDRVGEKHITNEGYTIEIVKYFDSSNSTISFEDERLYYNIQYENIRTGKISNPYHPSVCGIGYIGVGKYTYKLDVYKKWCGVIQRGYSEKFKLKQPAYKSCSVDERWYNFQVFAEWHEQNYKDGFELDKDILLKGNKIYSPETCCFVPQEVNLVFTKTNAKRGQYPIGVRKSGNNYIAVLKKNNISFYLGTFKTELEAFQAYKTAKEVYIKEVADKWRGQITEKVYEAMYNYVVEITD